MAIVIALEGGDGSGKSTVATYFTELSEAAGLSCRVIGRYAENSTETIGRITEILQSNKETNGDKLTFEADIFMRVSREFQRASFAKLVAADIVILDRFVLSVSSRALINKVNSPHLEDIFLQILSVSELHATIFCKCPFDKAWKRVIDRVEKEGKALSPKERLGEEYNKELFSLLESEFDRGVLTSRKLTIDTAGLEEDTLRAAKSYFDNMLAERTS